MILHITPRRASQLKRLALSGAPYIVSLRKSAAAAARALAVGLSNLSFNLSPKTATLMIALAAPALLCLTLFTLPLFLFPTPEHHAYFHFSQVLQVDPARWMALALAGCCSILAITVPAAIPQRS